MRETLEVHGDLELILLADAAERFRCAPDIRHWGPEEVVIPSEDVGTDPAFTFRRVNHPPVRVYDAWTQDVAAHGEPMWLCRTSGLEALSAQGPLNDQNAAWMALQGFLEAALPLSAAWCFILSHASEGPYEEEFGDLRRIRQRLQAYALGITRESFAIRFPPLAPSLAR
ncbi:hypothetical protein [Deinococcus sonorensis]|uniref:Uncharacterized protein n=1 Tax=Deinococcus sonorensis TaxID=309891 RepID=A0ABV8YB65_9DEIO